MKRRQLWGFLAAASSSRLTEAFAQQGPKPIPVIGVLVAGTPDPTPFWRLLRQGLADLGYVEGRNVRFEYRSANGVAGRLPELAAELVHLNVDLIVAWQTPTVLAVAQQTKTIPIVMMAGAPVETGLVASLARPGGNVTGIAAEVAEAAGKGVELIHELLPTAHDVAVLVNERDPFSKHYLANIREAGRVTGIEVRPIPLRGDEDFDPVFQKIDDRRPAAVIIHGSLRTRQAAEMALRHRLPAVSVWRWFAEEVA